VIAVRELRPGLRHWQAPHPDWRPGGPTDRAALERALSSHSAT
jgi:hypothetical protein